MGTMIHDEPPATMTTITGRSSSQRSTDRSELDDLLDEILADQVFQTDFSRLRIADERNSAAQREASRGGEGRGGGGGVGGGGSGSSGGGLTTRGSDRNQWGTTNEFSGSSVKQIISTRDHPDIQIEIKFNPTNSSSGVTGGEIAPPRPPPPQESPRREWCETPDFNSYQQTDSNTSTYRQRALTFDSGTASKIPAYRQMTGTRQTEFGQASEQQRGYQRGWGSDSEDPMSWLDQQRMKLQSKRTVGGEGGRVDGGERVVVGDSVGQHRAWMVNRTKQECALVAELKSAQKTLLKKQTDSSDWLSSQSRDVISANGVGGTESDEGRSKDGTVNPEGGLRTNFTRQTSSKENRNNVLNNSESSSRGIRGPGRSVTPGTGVSGDEGEGGGQCKTEKNYFVSGIERPPFTTHQTKYFFCMSEPNRVSPGGIGMQGRRGEVYSPMVGGEETGGVGSRSTPVTPRRGVSSREALKQSMSYDWGLAGQQHNTSRLDSDNMDFNFDDLLEQLESSPTRRKGGNMSTLSPSTYSRSMTSPSNFSQPTASPSTFSPYPAPLSPLTFSPGGRPAGTLPAPSPTRAGAVGSPVKQPQPSFNGGNVAGVMKERMEAQGSSSGLAQRQYHETETVRSSNNRPELKPQPSLDEILQEVIMLKPIGRGLHNLETDDESTNQKRGNSPAMGLENRRTQESSGTGAMKRTIINDRITSTNSQSPTSSQPNSTNGGGTTNGRGRSLSADILQNGRPVRADMQKEEWQATTAVRYEENRNIGNDRVTQSQKENVGPTRQKSVDFGYLGSKDGDVAPSGSRVVGSRQMSVDGKGARRNMAEQSNDWNQEINRQNGMLSEASSNQSHSRHTSKSSGTLSQDGRAVDVSNSRQQGTSVRDVRNQRWGRVNGENSLTVDTTLAQSAATAAREKRVADDGGRHLATSPEYIRTPKSSGTSRTPIYSPNLQSPTGFRPSPLGNDTLSRGLQTPCFVKDSSKFWHRPHLSRDEAIEYLKNKPPGTFVVRNSNSFPGAFGLAMKVAHLPPNVRMKGSGDPQSELVRHFLIEPTAKGVRLKGCSTEPVFGSLAALVYQHSLTALSLPCKLIMPDLDNTSEVEAKILSSPNPAAEALDNGAACNVLYVNSVDMESLTGPEAIARAFQLTVSSDPAPKTTVVHFKVTGQGITLTDNNRRLFFRRHYPVDTVTFSGMDPENRKWCWINEETKLKTSAKVFGFVARKQGHPTDNSCHLFAELDADQPAEAIVSFIMKIMLGLASSHRN